METDVLIIGGGVAGLAAALEVSSSNLSVTIVDESYQLGGQLPQQTQMLHSLPADFEPMRGFELAERLIEKLPEQEVNILTEHKVIGFYEDGSVGISDDENVYPVKAKRIIVATGAAEQAIPFLKWTLPGIMTIGAAQTLINRDFVLPGKDAVIVGTSDFALDVAWQLQAVGVKIKGILESGSEDQAIEQDRHLKIQSLNIPIFYNAKIKEAKGNGQVEEIVVEQNGHEFELAVDVVCLDGGRTPILDVFYQLGCSFGYEEALGGWVPQYNEHLQTSKDHVYIAGNAAGISHQGALLVTGRIAGVSACESLLGMSKADGQVRKASLWKELELLERSLNPSVWEARRTHINQFLLPKLKDQFIS